MTFNSRREGNVKIISVSGFLDAGQVTKFREDFQAESAEEDAILLDCTALEYLDSSGLATLVSIYKALAARNAKLVIFGFSESILRVLRFTKLDRVFTLAKDLTEATTKASS
jgi:anti-sigma B factor antagonist